MYETPGEFLNWLLSVNGLSAAISFLTGVIVPDVLGTTWEALIPPRWRRLAVIGLCFVVTGIATLLLRLMCGIPLDETIVWNALLSIFFVYTGTSVANSYLLPSTRSFKDKRAGYALGKEYVPDEYRWRG